MNITYANLGFNADGSVRNPRNDEKVQVVDFESIWKHQLELDPANKKGSDGAIFPLSVEVLYSIDYIRENSICSNGLIFIDIDHLTEEQKRMIFDSMEEINSNMGLCIKTASVTKGGMHIICVSDELTADEYRLRSIDAMCMFAKSVLVVTGIDLRDNPIDENGRELKILDTHNTIIKQRFFLRPTNDLYWSDNSTVYRVSESTRVKIKQEYGFLYDKISRSSESFEEFDDSDNLLVRRVKIDNNIHLHHLERYNLYRSLMCCFSGAELQREWERCVSIFGTGSHSLSFYLSEPKKNRWNTRKKVINYKLLSKFGYYIIGKTENKDHTTNVKESTTNVKESTTNVKVDSYELPEDYKPNEYTKFLM